MKYSLKDLAKKIDVSPDVISLWVEKGLISTGNGNVDFFTQHTIKEAEFIKKFLAMGYSLGEIAKIRKEIGLPLKDSLKTSVNHRNLLTVGELAEMGGVNSRTIKFWEEKGLIKPAQRTEGGFRLFSLHDIERIKIIKDLQTFNYTLSEIGNILKLIGTDVDSTEDLNALEPKEIEKIKSALTYLIERMQEIRKASVRLEALFSRRLKRVSRFLPQR